jgi:hypothetical protein
MTPQNNLQFCAAPGASSTPRPAQNPTHGSVQGQVPNRRIMLHRTGGGR